MSESKAVLVAVSLKAYFGYAQARDWLAGVADLLTDHPLPAAVELAVMPPFPLLERALDTLGRFGVRVGSQDVSWAEPGPVTGEVTAALLAEMGCQYAEVGHAERRTLFGEDDVVVNRKAAAAARHRLVPLICVGEAVHDPDTAAAEVVRQARLVTDQLAGQPVVIAYEPQWAIGADAPADTGYVLRVGEALKTSVPALAGPAGRLIYGGTAGPGTLRALHPGFDGVFLGRRAHRIDGLRQVLDEAVETLTG